APRPDAPVIVEPGRLRLPGLVLTWDEAAPIGCAIPAPPPGLDRAVVDTLRHHGTGRATGLDSPRGVAARAALAGAIGSGDAARLVEAASGLLGLGEGLTPAGDDCLVGALAVLHAIGHPAPRSRRPRRPDASPASAPPPGWTRSPACAWPASPRPSHGAGNRRQARRLPRFGGAPAAGACPSHAPGRP